jgi:hypothetical protein
MNNEEQPKMNGWQVLCKKCFDLTGLNLSGLTWSGRMVLLVWLVAPPLFPFALDWIKDASQAKHTANSSQTAAIGNSESEGSSVAISGNDNEVQIIEGHPNQKVIFNTEKWRDGLGELAVSVSDSSRIFLPPNIKSGTRRYFDPLPRNIAFIETRFIPLGSEAINFVISIPGVYEIIVGDSDYRNVVLKRSDGKDEIPKIRVPEHNLGTERTPFKYIVKRGKEIGVNLKQEVLQNGNLWVQLDIQYWGEGQGQKLPQTFQYEFKPSPWFEDSLFLHIGLIQDENKKDVSAEIITPILFK